MSAPGRWPLLVAAGLFLACVGPLAPDGEPLEAVHLRNTTGDTASVWVTMPYDSRTGTPGSTHLVSGHLYPGTEVTLSPGEDLPHPTGRDDHLFAGYPGGLEVSVRWESDRRGVNRWVEGPAGPVLLVRVTEEAVEVERRTSLP